ncbi:trypsin-like peptidase domain-containing protein [Carboxylicivirga sp. M1479]|uniref:trypsin-like peptidase domain-containing protein n=1 Tax=Carboxylicivirga sp. M1479 TaxID=2594476 RepID=UPI00163D953B|nr:trypsin-like peptidase domain-containing protein [Carboxylicivirga sp. M1479]
MYRYIFLLLVLVNGFVCHSQISHGGKPFELKERQKPLELSPAVEPKAVSAVDLENNKFPLRFAEPIFTNFTPQNSGEWDWQDGKYIWRLFIRSEGAKSLNLVFDRFTLKDGDRLFVYNPDKSHVLGGFTNANNNASKLFSIAPVLGDELIVELQTLRKPTVEHEITINAVNHDFLGVLNYLKRESDFGQSGECNINAICGDVNSAEINRSVCKVIVGGSMLCSGTLLNNTSENGKPYFLTAAHCFDNYNITSSSISAQNIIFYFNFDSPTCDPSALPNGELQSLSGADIKAFVEDMDFALLEMSKMPPPEYQAYWAGWKRDGMVSSQVFCVHHPWGDVKKVSESMNAPISTTFNYTKYNGVKFRNDVHWKIDVWASGVTEGGSSGSGLFTDDQYLIGSLSGGEAYCGNPYNDYYSRFNQAWSLNVAREEQLAYWLDAQNSDANLQNGVDYYSNKEIISHAKEADEKKLVRVDEIDGTLSGHNSMGYDAYAEYYDEFSVAQIAGVYLSPGQIDATGEGQTFSLKVWSESSGQPDEVLGAMDDIALDDISTAKQLFTFDEPLSISGPVFVGLELNYSPLPIDTLAIYQGFPNGAAPLKNTAYIRSNNAWQAYNSVHPSGENGSYLIDLLVYNDYIPTDTGDIEVDYPEVLIRSNPISNGVVEFRSNIEDLNLVEIYGLNGSKLKVYTIHNATDDSFSVQGLPDGIYMLKFISPTASLVKKILILQ